MGSYSLIVFLYVFTIFTTFPLSEKIKLKEVKRSV